MKKIIVFPGSFDPITLGHEDLVMRASALFDHVIVAVAHNINKQAYFSHEQRLDMAAAALSGQADVSVMSMEGLLVDFLAQHKTIWVLRGMRNHDDRRYEQDIYAANRLLMPGIEMLSLWSKPELSGVTSSTVREILAFNGDISAFVSKSVHDVIGLREG